MKILLTLFLALTLSFTACNNSSTAVAPPGQKAADAKIIAEYASKNGLKGQSTPSGIYYVIEKEGSGPSAKDLSGNSKVSAHYHGTFLDGKVFDSSVERGKPLDFELREVIGGWQEGIKLLNVGSKGTFLIPSHLAYGAKGFSSLIAPNTVLKFEVELLSVGH